LNALIGNRLYTWEPPASLVQDVKRADNKLDVYEHTLFRRQRADVEYAKKLAGKHQRGEKFASKNKIIPVPPFLDCAAFAYGVFFCCKPKWFRDYEDAMDEVENDMSRSLDVVDFMRRMRMHGFALTSMF